MPGDVPLVRLPQQDFYVVGWPGLAHFKLKDVEAAAPLPDQSLKALIKRCAGKQIAFELKKGKQ